MLFLFTCWYLFRSFMFALSPFGCLLGDWLIVEKINSVLFMILSVLKKRPRNSSVELLRILSMTMIVMFHFCANAYRYNSADFVCGHDSETLIKLIFHALGQTGVPVFMFISGYYGIHFKKNRLIDIILQCFFYFFFFPIM